MPDLPLDELEGWGRPAAAHGVETVLLAAPTTPDERCGRICERSQGFIYGVSLLGVTGERRAGGPGRRMARRLKAITDKPVLLGVGISTPEQAVEAARTPTAWSSARPSCGACSGRAGRAGGRFVAEVRAALDAAARVAVP